MTGGDAFFINHFPFIIDGTTYLLYKNGFQSNCEPEVYKAILNGYPIDTQRKTELTDDLLADENAYQQEQEKSMVILDIWTKI